MTTQRRPTEEARAAEELGAQARAADEARAADAAADAADVTATKPLVRAARAPIPDGPARRVRPTAQQLAAAQHETIPDVLATDLRVLFCGINPGLWSAAIGKHFARPGNRFWPALHASGFTPRLLGPYEQEELPRYGLGLTNVVSRASARADELAPEEFREGGRILAAKVAEYRPRWVAILGIGAYRTAFDRKQARVGPQPEPLSGSRVWVLPNPSGLNALWTTPRLADAFRELRDCACG
nr:G/U mismatch-specific DNA glycosylase [Actinocrinis puniceicyclus]